MTDLQKAAQQALEALKKSHPYSNSGRDLDKHSEAIHALRAVLAEPMPVWHLTDEEIDKVWLTSKGVRHE